MKRILLTCILAIAALPAISQQAPAVPSHAFTIQDDHFALNGKPFKIISGELHYARIPRQYWRARLRMAHAMGLNTIATYVFWNVHEPTPGHFDFSGNNDLAEFIREAQQEGLHVILRAGPYSCAEWEFGGFPPGSSKIQRWPPRIPKPSAPTTQPSWSPSNAGSIASPRRSPPSRSTAAAPSS